MNLSSSKWASLSLSLEHLDFWIYFLVCGYFSCLMITTLKLYSKLRLTLFTTTPNTFHFHCLSPFFPSALFLSSLSLPFSLLHSNYLLSPLPLHPMQAVWALGNIAGDSPECRDVILGSAIMPHLLKLLLVPDLNLTVLRNAAWTLSNLCRGKNPEPPSDVVSPVCGWDTWCWSIIGLWSGLIAFLGSYNSVLLAKHTNKLITKGYIQLANPCLPCWHKSGITCVCDTFWLCNV